MKNTHKYVVSLLLLIVFSLKVALPLFAQNGLFEKVDTAQEQKADEEKSGEKSASYKSNIEVADMMFMQPLINDLHHSDPVIAWAHCYNIPTRFSTVPTPPPWG